MLSPFDCGMNEVIGPPRGPMNIIEFIVAPDLLLFGRVNAVVAFFFILLLYFNEFVLNRKTLQTA